MKVRILYIEDEPFLGKIVKESLEQQGYTLLLETDGAKVIDAFRSFKPDLCVMDVMLPHVDGFSLAKGIRSIDPVVPVIFLTAKSQTEDLIKGFDSGGTDYIKKPFSLEELIARINNQLNITKRNETSESEPLSSIRIGNYVFHPDLYQLDFDDQNVRLSHREAQLLMQFCKNQNQVIERKNLLLAIWGDDSFFNSRTLDVYIRKLRDYFSADDSIQIITLKGKGYHFRVN
ncbi:MAG TPA: response regulator transcription factor [Bacteroidia bacterium]|nr:response regulator transcription factor [Bacteroidia bacterium]